MSASLQRNRVREAIVGAFLLLLPLGSPGALASQVIAPLGPAEFDVQVYGVEPGQRVVVLHAPADLNGDGIGDLVLGGETIPASRTTKRVSLVFGRSNWVAEVPIDGAAEDVILRMPDGTGPVDCDGVADFNGDGFMDLMLRSRHAVTSTGLVEDAGAVYVIYGRSVWPEEIQLDAGEADILALGTAGRQIQKTLAADLDGDGSSELLIANELILPMPNRFLVSVWFGGPTLSGVIDFRSYTPDLEFNGFTMPVLGGPMLADVTGDTKLELVGDISGAIRGIENLLDHGTLVDVNQIPHAFVVDYEAGSPGMGLAEVTGDGTIDLIVGDELDGEQRVRVFAGGPSIDGTQPHASITVERFALGAGAGRLARNSQDYDADGVQEIYYGHSTESGSRNRIPGAGEVHFFESPVPSGNLIWDAQEGDFSLQGTVDAQGVYTVFFSDLNGDGVRDLIVGGQRSDSPLTGAPDAGVTGIVLGFEVPLPGPTEVFVDPSLGDDMRDGTSWSGAKATLNAALEVLDRSRAPATIHIRSGTFAESIRIGGSTTLLGGYASDGVTRDPVGQPSVIDATGISSSVVEFRPRISAEPSILDGFLLTGGRAANGGGVHVWDGGYGVVSNSAIAGNTAVGRITREDIICYDPDWTSEVHTDACWQDADAGMGVGIYVRDEGRLELENVLIANNRVEVEREDCTPWFRSSQFYLGCPCDRTELCTGRGGAVWADGDLSEVQIRSATVTRNEGPGVSIHIRSFLPRELTIHDSIITGNTAVDLDDQAGDPGFQDIIWCLIGDPGDFVPNASNLIGADPLFVDPDNGNFSLQQAPQDPASPAVDAGSPSSEDTCFTYIPNLCMADLSTRTDGVLDSGRVDMGFHGSLGVPNRPPEFSGIAQIEVRGTCQLVLQWDRASDPEGHEPILYRIYRAEAPGGFDWNAPVAVLTAGETTWIDTDLSWGTVYYYAVRAEDALGLEDQNVVELSATPTDDRDPEIADFDAISVGVCDVLITQSGSDNCSGIAATELHRSDTPGFIPDPGTLIAVNPGGSHIDVTPSNGIWYYKAVLMDAAGNRRVSNASQAHVSSCAGPVPGPGEARIVGMRRTASGIALDITPAPGASFHRLYRGILGEWTQGGYTHAVSLGPDRILGTDDDTGVCSFDTLEAVDPGSLGSGSNYFLAVGVDDSGEGTMGWDSSGILRPDGTILGTLDCMP